MKIYIAGPITAKTKEEKSQNIARADEIARALLAKGHEPFCPHTMTRDWEDDKRFHHDPKDVYNSTFLQMDFRWLLSCDALFFIRTSPGADAELAVAEAAGMPIFFNLKAVAERTPDPITPDTVRSSHHQLNQVFRRQMKLLTQRGMQYKEHWRQFGIVVFVVSLHKKLCSILNRFGIELPEEGPGIEGLLKGMKAYELSLDQSRGMHEDCKDALNYLALLEAGMRGK